MKGQDQLFSSSKQDWNTPKWLFDYLNSRFGPFDLDAAADDNNHLCEKYFTEQNSALANNWEGKVFCNPPYSKKLQDEFLLQGFTQCALGYAERIVFLIPARTDKGSWHDIIAERSDLIIFIKGRLRFGGAKDSAPFPSAVVVFTPDSVKNSQRIDIAAYPRVEFLDLNKLRLSRRDGHRLEPKE